MNDLPQTRSRLRRGIWIALGIPVSTLLLLATYVGLYLSLGGGFLIVDGVVRFQVRTFAHPFVAKAFQPAARVETMLTGTTVHATDAAAYFGAMNAQTAQGASMK